ncbi:uncharacterized protein LOC110668637 isoform X2 [Hevea brasiliensis]|uniref:uncharacterized protein LOC110668637 isoform X2 n=1 Tax=Hevea brasiliensis TaxID=3981 RepID=UPI0025E3C2E6|nr:uncharacterized protein LOC110668637 isoform X2 [Hevea brasiliensis]
MSSPPGTATCSSCFSGENGGLHGDDDRSIADPRCVQCMRSDPPSCSSSSSSSLGFDPIPLKESEKLWRVITAWAKGFSIGAGLKGGLSLFSIIARLRRTRLSSSSRKVFSNSEAIALAIKETLRYGLFLGTFAGTFASVDEIIASLGGHHRSAYILKQESLAPSYKSFLNKHGGKDPVILQGMKEIASGLPFTDLDLIEKYYNSTGVNIKLDPEMKIPCSIIHGNQSCSGHVMSFFIQAYKRALPVYLPVYLIPALIVHRQGLLKRPYSILGKGLLGTARSSLFLSTYCSSAWMWTCVLFRIFRRCNIPMVAMGTFPTGLALAIEKKSRRIEISLYCLARAIESFFTCMADVEYLPQAKNLKRADVLIFSISTAIIMHCYAQEREVFRSKYLNVLDWVFGVPPSPGETPRRKES